MSAVSYNQKANPTNIIYGFIRAINMRIGKVYKLLNHIKAKVALIMNSQQLY